MSSISIVDLIMHYAFDKLRKTRKNSKNSSLPSSQTPKYENAKPNPKSKGKGKKVGGRKFRQKWVDFQLKEI